MPRFDVTAPDGRTIEVTAPEGTTEAQAIAYAQANWASLSAAQPAGSTSGFIPALKSGTAGLAGALANLAGRTGLVDVEEAKKYAADKRLEAQRVFQPTQDDWATSPWLKTKELLGQSIPYMAAPIAAGAGAAVLGAPTAVGLGAAGLASLGQFTGTNLSRQVQEGTPLEKTNLAGAGAAAVPQAVLDMVSFRAAPLIRGLFKEVGKEVGEKAAQKIAEQGLKKAAADYAKSTGKAMTAEGLTEAGQQLLERMQAGLSLTNADARDEYWDSLVGGAVLGGALAPAGRFVERGRERTAQDKQAAEEKAAAFKAAKAQEEAAAEAEAKRRSTPEYAQEVEQRYRALEQQKQELQASLVKPDKNSPTYTADKIANKETTAEIARLVKEELMPAALEYRRVQKMVKPATEATPAQETKPAAVEAPPAPEAGDTTPNTDLFGNVLGTPQETPEPEVPVQQRLGELQQQIRLLGGMEEGPPNARQPIRGRVQELQDAVAAAKTPEEVLQLGRQHMEAQQTLDNAVDEFHKLYATTKMPSAEETLAKKYNAALKAMQKAQEEGDTPLALKYATKAQALNKDGAADMALATVEQMKALATQQPVTDRWKIPQGAESVESFNQRVVGPEMAAGREAAAAQRQRVESEVAGIRGLAEKPKLDDAYTEARKNATTRAEIRGMESARINPYVTEQAVIPGVAPAQPLQSRIVRGVGVEGRSEAELVADIQRARATGNRGAVSAAIEALRDARAKGAEEAPTGSLTTDIAGTQPRQVSAQQDALISRGQSMSQLLQALTKWPEDVEAARGRVLERLARDIEATTGAALPQSARYTLASQANPILDTLVSGKKSMEKARAAQAALDAVRNKYTSNLAAGSVESTFTPKTTSVESLRQQLARAATAPNVTPEQQTMLQQVEDKFDSLSATPEQRNDIAEWLHKDLGVGVESDAARRVTQHLDAAARPEEDAAQSTLFPEEQTDRPSTQAEIEQARLRGQLRAAAEQEQRAPSTPARTGQVVLARDKVERVEPAKDTLKATQPTPVQEREAQDAAKRKDAQARAERLAELPGVRVTHEAYAEALRRLEAAPDRIAEKAKKAQDMSLPETTRKKARREELALRRSATLASGLLSNDSERAAQAKANLQEQMDKVGVAIEAEQEILRDKALTKKQQNYRKEKIAELRKEMRFLKTLMHATEKRAEVSPIATSEAKAAQAEDRRAEDYLNRVMALDAVGTTGKLPPRVIGPVARKGTVAGNMRTGVAETTEARKVGAGNKSQQTGKRQGPTAAQATRAAAKDTAHEQAMLQLSNIEDLQERNDAALEAAREAADTAKIAKYEGFKKRLETAHSKAAKQLSEAYVKVAREKELAEAFAGEWENSAASANREWKAHMLPADVVEAVRDGRLLDALGMIAKNGSSPQVKALAARLRPLVMRTKLAVVPDLKHDGVSVAGKYSPKSNSIGLHPLALSEETLLHEVTHAATDSVLLGAVKLTDPAAIRALDKLHTLYAQAEKHPSFKGEHISTIREFVAEINSNPQVRKKLENMKLWTRFVAIIRQILGLPPSSMQLVDKILTPSRAIKSGTAAPSAMRDSTALGHAASAIVAQPKTFKERLGNNLGLETEMQLVDMRAGVREALKAGAENMGDDKDFRQAMYSLTKADQRMTLVGTALTNGYLELYKDAKGYHGVQSSNKTSAKDIFAAVADIPGQNAKEKAALATTYMIAQRAANVGFDKLNMGDLDVTEAQLDAAMKEVDANPEMKKALEKVRALYNKYNAGMIKFLADTGAIPQERADALLKNEDYVPYYRVDANGMASLAFDEGSPITIGDVRHQPYLANLKGGQTKIMPINESIPRNTMLLVDKALTNMAAKNVAYAAQAYGGGKIQKGISPAAPDVIRFNQEPDPNDKHDNGERWIQIKTEGTAMEGVPSALVVKSLEGAHLTLPAFLKWGSIAGDLLRSGVTRSPLYVLRQLWRDPMIASFTGGLNYGPLKAIVKAGKEYVAQTRDTSAAGAVLARKGLTQSQIFNGDADDLSKMSLQLASGKDASVLDKVLAMADRAAMRADASTRALVYDNAIANGMSEVEADMTVMESMNFHKRGLSPTVQYASRMIPFFNAQIQGLNVLYKAARGQMPYEQQLQVKRKFMNNARMLMLGGVAYAMAMQDDDDFRNAKPRDRYTNFFIPVPGMDSKLKLPIPYEAGWFFSFAVATVDAMREDVSSPEQFRALRDMFIGSVPGGTNLMLPQLVKPAFEVWTNKNFLSGQEIETPGQRRLDPAERYSASTTEAAKMLAQVVPGMSPVQIEHLVRGYLGTIPLMAAAAANELFTPEQAVERPTGRLTDKPLVGGLFQREYGGADIDAAFKEVNKAQEAKATFDKLRKEGRREEALEYREKNLNRLRMEPVADVFEQRMRDFKEIENRIRASSMTGDAKQARLDALDEKRAQVAKAIRAKLRSVEAAPA